MDNECVDDFPRELPGAILKNVGGSYSKKGRKAFMIAEEYDEGTKLSRIPSE